jgi:acyl-CoA thioesterase FadM
VPIGRELVVRAWVTDIRGRRIHVDGKLLCDDEVLAEVRCAFLHVPLEHFLLTPEGRAAAERWRETLNP